MFEAVNAQFSVGLEPVLDRPRTGRCGMVGNQEVRTMPPRRPTKKRPRKPSRPHPAFALEETLSVARAIQANNAGQPMNRVLLATAMGYSPSTTKFRELLSSSIKYGLTKGSEKASAIEVLELGARAISPTNSPDRAEARRQAFFSVPLYKRIADHYTNNKVPDLLPMILGRPPYGIDLEWAEDVAKSFRENARFLGYLQPNGFLVLEQSEGLQPAVEAAVEAAVETEVTPDAPDAPDVSEAPDDKPLRFFIAHGKKHLPLNQLTKLLDGWGVKHAVAKDEPHEGRPIPEKVADTMKGCTAGIFIFTAEDGYFDEAGQPLPQPNLNVVFELGAASLLYGRKIVVFKQRGVEFPSDFDDLGYISFEGDNLKSAGIELLNELIKLGAVRMTAG